MKLILGTQKPSQNNNNYAFTHPVIMKPALTDMQYVVALSGVGEVGGRGGLDAPELCSRRLLAHTPWLTAHRVPKPKTSSPLEAHIRITLERKKKKNGSGYQYQSSLWLLHTVMRRLFPWCTPLRATLTDSHPWSARTHSATSTQTRWPAPPPHILHNRLVTTLILTTNTPIL